MGLKRLAGLKATAESNIHSRRESKLDLSPELCREIVQSYSDVSTETVFPFDWGIKVTSQNGNESYLPFQWFSTIQSCSEYIVALHDYSLIVDKLSEQNHSTDPAFVDSMLRRLPLVDWQDTLGDEEVSFIERFLADEFEVEADRECFREFLDGRSWLNTTGNGLVGKKLNRGSLDYISSAVSKVGKLLDVMSGRLDRFIKIFLENSRLRELLSNASFVRIDAHGTVSGETGNYSIEGENKIFYGAPGTGKSYTLRDSANPSYSVTTVFHPDTQYTDFVGCLKPTMANGSVVYEFRPGPFCDALKLAYANEDEHCSLVIEEINRAASAAVFGEVFQLLDRKTGSSEYPIDVSDPDMRRWLEENGVPLPGGKLSIPRNLSLLATMNSSDQAVMPMDTAFKRRWTYVYKPVDLSVSHNESVYVTSEGGLNEIKWRDFAAVINEQLLSSEVPEDRLLGPWFVRDTELIDEDSRLSTLKGKVFLYLWDDVLRHSLQTTIFGSSYRGYGELVEAFDNREQVFNDTVFAALEPHFVLPSGGEPDAATLEPDTGMPGSS